MKKLSERLVESAKDDKRVNDLITKAKGDKNKETQLASNMAKAIKDKTKIKDRYDAALKILGKSHPVTNEFAKRANELGHYDIKTVTPKESVNTTQLPAFVFDKTEAEKLLIDVREMMSTTRTNNNISAAKNRIYKKLAQTDIIQVVILLNKLDIYKTFSNSKIYGQDDDAARRYVMRDITQKVIRDMGILSRQYDFGDAKTNPKNPAHFLFKTVNQKDDALMKLDELTLTAQDAYEKYKKPKSLFKKGDSYTQYSQQTSNNKKNGMGNNREIKFFNPWSIFFWNSNMIGQMSDGYWENSRKYDGVWRHYTRLLPVFDPSVESSANWETGYAPNPKLVSKYAIQSKGEEKTFAKVYAMNAKELLPLISYGKEWSFESVKTLSDAKSIANNYGISVDLFLAFLWEPGIPVKSVNKIVSQAHKDMIPAMNSHS